MEKQNSVVRRFLFAVVVRPVMFVLLASVFWGTLMLGTWIVSVARRGFAETWRAIRPEYADLWSTANFVLPLLAVVAWTLAAVAWAFRRSAAGHADAS
jgi:hypothetical protein